MKKYTVELNEYEMNFVWVALKARESEYLMKSGERGENVEIAEEYRKLAESLINNPNGHSEGFHRKEAPSQPKGQN